MGNIDGCRRRTSRFQGLEGGERLEQSFAARGDGDEGGFFEASSNDRGTIFREKFGKCRCAIRELTKRMRIVSCVKGCA